MENKYYLAVETRPRNYFPINLNDLNIFNSSPTSLDKLDALTLKFSKPEIFKAIKENNLLDIDLNMNLVIIYYENNNIRKIDALTKEINFDMWDFLKKNYNNKNVINKIYNFLNNKISEEEFKSIRESNDLEEFINNVSKLSYLNQRKLYFYLYE